MARNINDEALLKDLCGDNCKKIIKEELTNNSLNNDTAKLH